MSGHYACVAYWYNMARVALKAIPNKLSTAPGPSHEGPTLSRQTPFFRSSANPAFSHKQRLLRSVLGLRPFAQARKVGQWTPSNEGPQTPAHRKRPGILEGFCCKPKYHEADN